MAFIAKKMMKNFESLPKEMQSDENKQHLNEVTNGTAQLSEDLQNYFYNEMPTPVITFDPEIHTYPIEQVK